MDLSCRLLWFRGRVDVESEGAVGTRARVGEMIRSEWERKDVYEDVRGWEMGWVTWKVGRRGSRVCSTQLS